LIGTSLQAMQTLLPLLKTCWRIDQHVNLVPPKSPVRMAKIAGPAEEEEEAKDDGILPP